MTGSRIRTSNFPERTTSDTSKWFDGKVKNYPKDSCARIVTFSTHGRKLLKQAITVIAGIDESYSAGLGADRYRALRSDLDILVKFLQSQSEGGRL